MKTITHIKTGDFEFLEIQDEVTTIEEALESHNRAVSGYKASEGGLEAKEWCRIVEGYLTTGTMSSDQGEKMSKAQKWFIAEIDRAFNRLKYREAKEDNHLQAIKNEQ